MRFLCISDHTLDLSSISFLTTFIGHVTFKRKYRDKKFTKWIRNHDVVARSLSHIQFFYDPMDCSLPGTSVHGISQARILEWVAISFSRRSSWPGIKPTSPALQVYSLSLSHLGSPCKSSTSELRIMIFTIKKEGRHKRWVKHWIYSKFKANRVKKKKQLFFVTLTLHNNQRKYAKLFPRTNFSYAIILK